MIKLAPPLPNLPSQASRAPSRRFWAEPGLPGPKPPLGLYAATRRYRRQVVKPQLTSDLKLVLITTVFPSPCSPKSASSMSFRASIIT